MQCKTLDRCEYEIPVAIDDAMMCGAYATVQCHVCCRELCKTHTERCEYCDVPLCPDYCPEDHAAECKKRPKAA